MGVVSCATVLPTGQFCTSPGIVFIQDNANGDASIVSKFTDALVRAVEGIPVNCVVTCNMGDGACNFFLSGISYECLSVVVA